MWRKTWKWGVLCSRTETGQPSRAGEQESLPCAASDRLPNHLHCLCWPALSAGSVQPGFAAEQGLRQQHPEGTGCPGGWQSPAQHRGVSVSAVQALPGLSLSWLLSPWWDNGISQRHCGNSAISSRRREIMWFSLVRDTLFSDCKAYWFK